MKVGVPGRQAGNSTLELEEALGVCGPGLSAQIGIRAPWGLGPLHGPGALCPPREGCGPFLGSQPSLHAGTSSWQPERKKTPGQLELGEVICQCPQETALQP